MVEASRESEAYQSVAASTVRRCWLEPSASIMHTSSKPSMKQVKVMWPAGSVVGLIGGCAEAGGVAVGGGAGELASLGSRGEAVGLTGMVGGGLDGSMVGWLGGWVEEGMVGK